MQFLFQTREARARAERERDSAKPQAKGEAVIKSPELSGGKTR
jgi:hypothetical protein